MRLRDHARMRRNPAGPASRTVSRAELARNVAEVIRDLRDAVTARESDHATALAAVHPTFASSARNLAHYLALRSHDLRATQDALATLGLSSLGRAEADVLPALDAVLHAARSIAGEPADGDTPPPPAESAGRRALAAHASALFHGVAERPGARIMVTMPGAAADDPRLVETLVEAGMDIARINCAHDDPVHWTAIAGHVRAAAPDGRCLVAFDLAGPKLRTIPLGPGPRVLRVRPRRDALGRVVEPARVLLVRSFEAASEGRVPVDGTLLRRLAIGDELRCEDARGRKRVLVVRAVNEGAVLCETDRTAYLVPGMRLAARRAGKKLAEGDIGDLPALPLEIPLAPGDTLDVVLLGAAARLAEVGDVPPPPCVGCTVGAVFTQARVGQRVLFDDGRIAAEIVEASPRHLRTRITWAAGGRAILRGEKGINLPDTDLALAALGPADIEALRHVARHADLVALSFVQTPADVTAAIDALVEHGAADRGLVLKIETRAAFERLGELLLAAMRHPRIGVMVARGDLAAEVGFDRLAEVQEEILWLCEAAHVPVIWATQVLEALAQHGTPTRAEVTDAAMAGRAECVMLNKGEHVVEAVRFLADVMARMDGHQRKKTALLRRLGVAGGTSPAASARHDGASGPRRQGSPASTAPASSDTLASGRRHDGS